MSRRQISYRIESLGMRVRSSEVTIGTVAGLIGDQIPNLNATDEAREHRIYFNKPIFHANEPPLEIEPECRFPDDTLFQLFVPVDLERFDESVFTIAVFDPSHPEIAQNTRLKRVHFEARLDGQEAPDHPDKVLAHLASLAVILTAERTLGHHHLTTPPSFGYLAPLRL